MTSFGKRVVPVILIVVGSLIILVIAFPIISYSIDTLLFPKPNLIDPSEVSLYPVPVVAGSSGSGASDYTSASEWFIKEISLPEAKKSPVKFFTLTIPKLNLSEIPVEANGEELKKNAIHYPGTALPGEFGNTVIFGHSALPQFYKEGNPLTVFNPLLNVELGNDVYLNFDGVLYHYLVDKITEVDPSKIEVMAQNFDRRDLTLITCVPLGTYWKRLVVRARLVI